MLPDNRLLVSKGEDGKATVEVAHEALLRSWKVLQDLIREKEEIIVLRSRLYADAKQWDDLQKQDAVKASSELWGGSKLAKIVEFQKNNSLPNLDPVAIEFIKASISQAERQKNEKIRTARRIAAVSLVAVVISTGLGWMAWKQTQQAEFNLAHSRGFSSVSLFDQGKELDAFVEAIKAGKTLQNQHEYDAEVPNALQELLNKKSEHNRLVGHIGYFIVSFSRDGKTLASGNDDYTIKLWNVETGQEIRTLSGHNNNVTGVSFSPDGKTLVSGSFDYTIKLWNVETGKEIRTLKGHNDGIFSVSFSRDGKTLASGNGDNTIKLWNVETGQEIRTLKGHNYSVSSVSFSRDGKILASGSRDKTIKLWNVETGQEIRTLSGHNGFVESVSFSSDGKTLASGSSDNTIKLWNGNNGWDLDALMERSCDWVRVYLHNPNSGVREEDRGLCDGIGGKSSVSGF
jgi:WD40 repeat protein